jgi:uncharacterized protein with ParB-like and HNH nuclease domain
MITPDNNTEIGQEKDWFDDYAQEIDDFQIDEYDLTATPNDFNVITIYNFIERGAVKIPGFQRNYVWDIIRASKLIESLVLGLPVPQIFLYEKSRNSFLVIDGHQRLMSIYYFIKQRFPRKEKRVDLRIIFSKHGCIPDEILYDDHYFSGFKLNLPERLPEHPNKFKGLNYSTLGDYKTQFELRPIRNVIIKQNVPKDDDSATYEIFSRLNTGGINLSPQEIRASLHHSNFYDMLFAINTMEDWRRILSMPAPDLHSKDIEILLRGFAMLIDGKNYKPSLAKFLNQFSRKCESHSADQNSYLKDLFNAFLQACAGLPEDAFLNKKTGKFNIALYEATFTVSCEEPFRKREAVVSLISAVKLQELEEDPGFSRASLEGTTRKANVKKRIDRARAILRGQ